MSNNNRNIMSNNTRSPAQEAYLLVTTPGNFYPRHVIATNIHDLLKGILMCERLFVIFIYVFLASLQPRVRKLCSHVLRYENHLSHVAFQTSRTIFVSVFNIVGPP